ncbi:kinase-like protein, partial [Ceratobasidium sp. AG-I]
MVAPLMVNGNLLAYIKKTPAADRCLLSIQIAEGLVYLHSSATIHGDLKGLNVLIDGKGTAKLTDFGNVLLEHYSLQFTTTTTKSSHSIRWTAPELLLDEGTYSMEADVYALGMV